MQSHDHGMLQMIVNAGRLPSTQGVVMWLQQEAQSLELRIQVVNTPRDVCYNFEQLLSDRS